jgi:hypothetical protein
MAVERKPGGTSLIDVLDRVLDKGIVIAGDIQINLLDIELLTVKLRLLVASVDRAKEMGIDWWENDPSLSSRAKPAPLDDARGRIAEIDARLERIERALTAGRTSSAEAVEAGGDDRS